MVIRHNGFIHVFVLSLIFLTSTSVAHQNNQVLTIAMPRSMANAISSNLFDDFEQLFDNVHIEVIAIDIGELPMDDDGTYDPLIGGQAYANMADVLVVDTNLIFAPIINVEQTLANFFLDLSPLIESDSGFDKNNFQPSAQNAFHWAGGIWAIPIFMDVQMFGYDPNAFVEANIQFPSANWALDDLVNTLNILAERNSENNIISSGFYSYGSQDGVIFSLLSNGLVEIVGSEVSIQIPSNLLEDTFKVWRDSRELWYSSLGAASDPSSAQLVMGPMSGILEAGSRLEPAPLPGGNGPLEFVGVSVSAGTNSPELSYELAKYINNQPEILLLFNHLIPARRTFVDNDISWQTPFSNVIDPEHLVLLEEILNNGLNTEVTQFRLQLLAALSDVSFKLDMTPTEAVEDLEAAITQRIERAKELAQNYQVSVNTPTIIDEGDLKFGVHLASTSMFIESNWDNIIERFLARETDLDDIAISTFEPNGQVISIESIAAEFDCFYVEGMNLDDSHLPSLYTLDSLIQLDPLLNSVDFDASIFSGVQKNGNIWGIPLSIDPMMILVDPHLPEMISDQTSQTDWTINEFINIILNSNPTPINTPIVQSVDGDDEHIVALISALGGLVFDYRTEPITFDFASLNATSAIEQILSLVQSGHIASPYVVNMGTTPLNSSILVGTHSRLSMTTNNYLPMTLPSAKDGAVLSLPVTMGSAYISRETNKIDACYSFISYLSQNPLLFNSISFYDFQLTDHTNIFGNEFYGSLLDFMNRSDVLLVPTANSAAIGENAIIRLWMMEIFSHYLNDADSETLTRSLNELQTDAEQFQLCVYDIALGDLTTKQLVDAYLECINEVDSDLLNVLVPQ